MNNSRRDHTIDGVSFTTTSMADVSLFLSLRFGFSKYNSIAINKLNLPHNKDGYNIQRACNDHSSFPSSDSSHTMERF